VLAFKPDSPISRRGLLGSVVLHSGGEQVNMSLPEGCSSILSLYTL